MKQINYPETVVEMDMSKSKQAEFQKLQRKTTPDQLENGESIEIEIEQNENPDTGQKEESNLQPAIDPSFERQLYQKFLCKVLGILFCMWAIVCIIVIIVIASKSLQEFMEKQYFIFYICIFLFIVIALLLYCYHAVARRSPYNYYMIFSFTILISYIFGYLCAQVSLTSMIIASALTVSLVVVIFMQVFKNNQLFIFNYALKTKTDITYKACAYGHTIVAIVLIVICVSTFRSKIVDVIVSLVFVGLLSFLMVYDVQKLRGKFHKVYEIDDYIIAYLDLYLEIVLIFKFLLAAIQSN